FDRDRVAHRNVERAAFALEKGEVQLAKEVLQEGWTPRWALLPGTRGLLDDARAQTVEHLLDLGDGLQLASPCFSLDGTLLRLFTFPRFDGRSGTETESTFHYFDPQSGQEHAKVVLPKQPERFTSADGAHLGFSADPFVARSGSHSTDGRLT